MKWAMTIYVFMFRENHKWVGERDRGRERRAPIALQFFGM